LLLNAIYVVLHSASLFACLVNLAADNALALPSNGSTKRKATELHDLDDFENLDPSLFSKRSKGLNSSQEFCKPYSFLLTKAASTPSLSHELSFSSTATTASGISAPSSFLKSRTLLLPKSPAAQLNTSLARSNAPLSAPAGRSPTRGSKRIGLLSSRRRTSGSGFSNLPTSSLSLAVPFSLDAALKGTIPSYASRTSDYAPSKASIAGLHEPELKSSWVFDIHEDTPEQEMTNLLQHSTCVLDISSDEESNVKVQRERAEGRDKENVPPVDDVSQTTRIGARTAIGNADAMIVEKVRDPLGEMNAADFYSAGCDGNEVVIVPGDDDEEPNEAVARIVVPPAAQTFDFTPDPDPLAKSRLDVDKLMGALDQPNAQAAVLEPIEGTNDIFELWESGSAKDEAEVPASPAPAAEETTA
jgi:hypothetical protein